MSGYAIDKVLSRVILNYLSQWHLVANFLQKKILAETQCKTQNGELLAIIEVFKT